MPPPPAAAFVVTCEHAGKRIPAEYARWFEGADELLASHRGWDPGAASLARSLSRRLQAPLAWTGVSRLLVETNRSESEPDVLSEFSRAIPDRERLLARCYRPYRRRVRRLVDAAVASGRPVVHISAHSFTPVWRGRVRGIDIGFLFDPSRGFESAVVSGWIDALAVRAPQLRIRRNEPYLGTDDGLTTTLRGAFADAAYAGIEIEVNQAITTGPPRAWRSLRRVLGGVCAAVPLSATRRGIPPTGARRLLGDSPADSDRRRG